MKNFIMTLALPNEKPIELTEDTTHELFASLDKQFKEIVGERTHLYINSKITPVDEVLSDIRAGISIYHWSNNKP